MTLAPVSRRLRLKGRKPTDLYEPFFPSLNYALTKGCKIDPLEVGLFQFIYGVIKVERRCIKPPEAESGVQK
jgi:hypothetical protein